MHRLTLLFLAFATAGAQPAFDVASIRAGEAARRFFTVVPGSLTTHTDLHSCIAWAYHLQTYQVSGPAWLDDVWFDIAAKSSAPATEDQLRVMLQSLLAGRFHLGLHGDFKEMQALVLTVGKNGHKMKPNPTEGSPSFEPAKMVLKGNGATIAQMTEFLSRELRQPVVDRTGLVERFDYTLDIRPYITEDTRKAPGPLPDVASLVAQAMQNQLGLKLESKKMPIEVLVIDRIEKSPTGN